LRRCETSTPTWFSASRPPFVPANVGEIDRLAAFADEHGLFTIISPPIITANRFGNTDLSDALSFSPADRRALLQLEYF